MNIKILFLGLVFGCQKNHAKSLEFFAKQPSYTMACGPNNKENTGLYIATDANASAVVIETEEKNYIVYLEDSNFDPASVNGSISLPYFDCDNIINIRLAR